MATTPLGTGVDGRDGRGRFSPGNHFGQGNPFAKRMAHLRAVLLQAITPADIEAAAKQLIEKARAGDLAAIKELLDRTIGKSEARLELTGLDGGPVGVSVQQLTAVVLDCLADSPEARVKVAARLKELSIERDAGAGGGA